VESSKRKVQSNFRRLVFAATAIVGTLASAIPAGQDKGVKASNAWVKLPAAGETEAMAFVTIENPGMYEVNVTSAKTDAAGRVQLRDAGQSGDARWKSVPFINVPAYGRVDMTPDGVYLMLVGLKRPLKEGDAVALTLSTDMDVTLDVTASVRGR
jgi:copper(I)-binding protein